VGLRWTDIDVEAPDDRLFESPPRARRRRRSSRATPSPSHRPVCAADPGAVRRSRRHGACSPMREVAARATYEARGDVRRRPSGAAATPLTVFRPNGRPRVRRRGVKTYPAARRPAPTCGTIMHVEAKRSGGDHLGVARAPADNRVHYDTLRANNKPEQAGPRGSESISLWDEASEVRKSRESDLRISFRTRRFRESKAVLGTGFSAPHGLNSPDSADPGDGTRNELTGQVDGKKTRS